jgi:hypothetical protein
MIGPFLGHCAHYFACALTEHRVWAQAELMATVFLCSAVRMIAEGHLLYGDNQRNPRRRFWSVHPFHASSRLENRGKIWVADFWQALATLARRYYCGALGHASMRLPRQRRASLPGFLTGPNPHLAVRRTLPFILPYRQYGVVRQGDFRHTFAVRLQRPALPSPRREMPVRPFVTDRHSLYLCFASPINHGQ